jgi:hypothetical protein
MNTQVQLQGDKGEVKSHSAEWLHLDPVIRPIAVETDH